MMGTLMVIRSEGPMPACGGRDTAVPLLYRSRTQGGVGRQRQYGSGQ